MRRDMDRSIKKALAKNHACYILITCDEPTEDGNIQVEMTYEGGDAVVASYLLQGAQNIIDDNAHLSHIQKNKIFPLDQAQ